MDVPPAELQTVASAAPPIVAFSIVGKRPETFQFYHSLSPRHYHARKKEAKLKNERKNNLKRKQETRKEQIKNAKRPKPNPSQVPVEGGEGSPEPMEAASLK